MTRQWIIDPGVSENDLPGAITRARSKAELELRRDIAAAGLKAPELESIDLPKGEWGARGAIVAEWRTVDFGRWGAVLVASFAGFVVGALVGLLYAASG